MDLPSHELQAFRTIAQTLNFSLAAERIHITQPALSQRIQSLEKTLGLTLFVRDPKGVRLTEAGLRLLRYCQIKDHLESELLSDLVKAPAGKLGGRLRISSYSSVIHSVAMPALAPLLRENPAVQFEFSTYEMDDLMQALERAETDFVIIDHSIERSNIQTVQLGEEVYVLVENRKLPPRDLYLDHDPQDKLTQMFLEKQGDKRPSFSRCYVDNMEGILRGIELGLGKGVVPRHLLPESSTLSIVKGKKPLKVPVVLHYFRQAYYSNLQKATIETLKRNSAQYLK
jgi:DNA-binding transcriptional LysR family regulator